MEVRKRIASSDLNERILKMMGSKHARKIIQVIHEKPLSASEISETCNIPLTKVYRWLRRLESCKLLHASYKINEKSRKISIYKSKVNRIMIDPTKKLSPGVEIMGSGNIIKCPKCGSANCTLIYDIKSNKIISQCINCKIKHEETLLHTLKEEQQKFTILDAHLKAILNEGKNKTK